MENNQGKDWNEAFFEYFEEMDFRSANYDIPEYLEHVDLDYIDILTGESFLHKTAASFGLDSYWVEKTIPSKGVDVSDYNGATPLFFALATFNLSAFKLLRAKGADLFHTDKEGGNILHYFVCNAWLDSEEGSYGDCFAGIKEEELIKLLEQRNSKGLTPKDILVKKFLWKE